MDRFDRTPCFAAGLFALAVGGCASPVEHGDHPPALAQEVTEDGTDTELPGLTGPRDLDHSGCKLDPTCTDIRTSSVNVNACCTKKVACGLDLSPLLSGLLDPNSGVPQWLTRPLLRDLLPPGTDLKAPCVVASSMWLPTQSLPDQRVNGSPEADVVLAQSCPSRMLVGVPIYGCCMPDNRCGYSTHYPLSDLRQLSLPGAPPIPHAQCLPASGVDAILKQTSIHQSVPVPPTSGTCNYRSMYDRLPKAEPPPQ